MSRFKSFGCAAIAGLALFSSVAGAQAATVYNAATDWAATYANTAAVLASTHASWGTEAQHPNAWSSGVLSWNWTNQLAVVGGSSLQSALTYYTPNTTGNETSGATIKGTFTYTVPFQAYQLNPGQSFQQAVGTTFTEQVASGFKPEKNGGADSTAITLPTGVTSAGAATGLLNEVGAAKAVPGSNSAGFTTSAYNPQSSKFNDGDGSVQAGMSGVFYNYATTNATSTSLGSLNVPSGSGTNSVGMSNLFGPSYVAWTAPAGAPGNGTAVVTLTASDLDNADDGDAGFFVFSSLSGATMPLLSAQNYSPSGGAGSQYIANVYNNYTDTTGGSGGITAPGSTTLGAASGTFTGVTQVSWTSGSIAIQPGETLYFIDDPGHGQYQTHGNHSTGSGTDGTALKVSVSYTPEPSSIVLFSMAGVGLALAAWKRRRAA
jgi:hypothetical protein